MHHRLSCGFPSPCALGSLQPVFCVLLWRDPGLPINALQKISLPFLQAIATGSKEVLDEAANVRHSPYPFFFFGFWQTPQVPPALQCLHPLQFLHAVHDESAEHFFPFLEQQSSTGEAKEARAARESRKKIFFMVIGFRRKIKSAGQVCNRTKGPRIKQGQNNLLMLR